MKNYIIERIKQLENQIEGFKAMANDAFNKDQRTSKFNIMISQNEKAIKELKLVLNYDN